MKGCGKAAWQALPRVRKLLQACREQQIPVAYSMGDRQQIRHGYLCGRGCQYRQGSGRGEGKGRRETGVGRLERRVLC